MSETPAPARIIITFAVMAATIMQVLDTTIVNVALPEMVGSLGATTDQISWVLTSYLVSSAVFMPLTGFFTDRLGRRKYLVISIGGFVISSMLCGISLNLQSLVVFRLMQGVFGAALVPLSQAIMVDTYPLHERGKAMAIWGVGVMVGPILGPTLGGWLTDMFSWRWTFFINLPVGILSLILVWRYVPDTPLRERRMDWTGLALISVAIAAGQFVLDQGNEKDWFDSRLITFATIISATALAVFLAYVLRAAHPVFDLRIFRDRNFATASIITSALGLGMYGSMFITPILLESLLGYPTVTTGLVMAPRGIASMFSMMVVGKFIGRVPTRILVGTGIVLGSIGTWVGTRYSLMVDTWWVIWPGMLQGVGIAMIYVPLSTVAMATIPREKSYEAAGLYSLVRTVGSSIGIAIVSTMFTRHVQISWEHLGAHLTPFNPAVRAFLAPLNLAPDSAVGTRILSGTVARQAQIMAVTDTFFFLGWSFIAMLPLILLLREKKFSLADQPPVHAGE